MPKRLIALRRTAAHAQSNRCHYCQLPVWEGDPSSFMEQYGVSRRQAHLFRCTAEHLLPKSEKGKETRQNIVAACWRCNQTRHRASVPLSPDVYKGYVEGRLRRGKWLPSELREKVQHVQ